MTFIPPTWFEGAMFYLLVVGIPIILAILLGVIGALADNDILFVVGIILLIIGIIAIPGSSVLWHYNYEVPSVQQETITVDDWQPTFGRYWGDVKSADDLMLKTSDGRLFGNNENFLFGKFNTRDILDCLKPNGTYKITYYGWREGYNNGVPNILSVDEIVNENNTPQHHDIGNYMNKRSIIYADNENW